MFNYHHIIPMNTKQNIKNTLFSDANSMNSPSVTGLDALHTPSSLPRMPTPLPNTPYSFVTCPLIKTYGFCYLTDKQVDSDVLNKNNISKSDEIDHINKYHKHTPNIIDAVVCPTTLKFGSCPMRDQEHIKLYGWLGHKA